MRRLALLAVLATMPAAAEPAAHDFTPTGKVLLSVGACGGGDIPDSFNKDVVKKHCELIGKTQVQYQTAWVGIAEPWFRTHVPETVPKKVVYPFAGGDLSTALTVYPDADEITTMSLEPAGDPRTLEALAKQKIEPDLVKTTKAAPPPRGKSSK